MTAPMLVELDTPPREANTLTSFEIGQSLIGNEKGHQALAESHFSVDLHIEVAGVAARDRMADAQPVRCPGGEGTTRKNNGKRWHSDHFFGVDAPNHIQIIQTSKH